jgi:1-acyl-sn-glycerol-3-phosphate acyltransferase
MERAGTTELAPGASTAVAAIVAVCRPVIERVVAESRGMHSDTRHAGSEMLRLVAAYTKPFVSVRLGVALDALPARVVLTANHTSYVDFACLLQWADTRGRAGDMRAIIAANSGVMREHPDVLRLVGLYGCVIDYGPATLATIADYCAALHAASPTYILVIMPEGTFSNAEAARRGGYAQLAPPKSRGLETIVAALPGAAWVDLTVRYASAGCAEIEERAVATGEGGVRATLEALWREKDRALARAEHDAPDGPDAPNAIARVALGVAGFVGLCVAAAGEPAKKVVAV